MNRTPIDTNQVLNAELYSTLPFIGTERGDIYEECSGFWKTIILILITL